MPSRLPDLAEYICELLLHSLGRFKLSRGVSNESELEEEVYKWLCEDVFSRKGGLLALRKLLRRQVTFEVGGQKGRIDLALANAVGIEIKYIHSENDLARLAQQLPLYTRAFRYVIVVCYSKRRMSSDEIRRSLGLTRRVKRVKIVSI